MSSTLTPLSLPRIRAALQHLDYSGFDESNGQLLLIEDDAAYFFSLLGENQEIFSIQAFWRESFDTKGIDRALDAVNKWNQDTFWPKGFLHEEGGALFFGTDLSVSYVDGATDSQLMTQVNNAMQTNPDFFAFLAKALPESGGAL